MRTKIAVIFILIQALVFIAWFSRGGHIERGETDFRSFYIAGLQVHRGQATEIYNNVLTQQLASTEAHVNDTRYLPYIHPAYEALLFQPLAKLEFKSAAYLYMLINAVLALAATLLVAKTIHISEPVYYLLALGFLPFGYALLIGQDSIMLLSLLAGSVWLLCKHRPLAAGLLAGLGVFRFQIMVPILLLFALWGFIRFVCGFLTSAAGCAIVSVAISGWLASKEYVRLLVGMVQGRVGHAFDQPIARMPNVRGFFSTIVLLVGGTAHERWLLIIIIAASVLLLTIAARHRPKDGVEALAVAVLVALLVDFHGLMYDTVLLLIPAAWFLFGEQARMRYGLMLYIAPVVGIWQGFAFLAAVPLTIAATSPALLEFQHTRQESKRFFRMRSGSSH